MSIKSAAKATLFNALRAVSPGLSGASILMYHSVGGNGAHFTVAPDAFERQMRYLARTRAVVPLPELADRLRKGESVAGCVALTFDDGYRDNLENALPILEKYNLPATIFVITGRLGEAFRNKSGSELTLLSREDLVRLAAHPLISLMPHSATHPKLTDLPLPEAIREMEDSRRFLEELTGRPARVFAYPKGCFSEDMAEHIRTGDWSAAVSTREGLVRAGDDPAALKRNAVRRAMSASEFKAKVSDAIGLYMRLPTR